MQVPFLRNKLTVPSNKIPLPVIFLLIFTANGITGIKKMEEVAWNGSSPPKTDIHKIITDISGVPFHQLILTLLIILLIDGYHLAHLELLCLGSCVFGHLFMQGLIG